MAKITPVIAGVLMGVVKNRQIVLLKRVKVRLHVRTKVQLRKPEVRAVLPPKERLKRLGKRFIIVYLGESVMGLDSTS
jgi:hypothetical protein